MDQDLQGFAKKLVGELEKTGLSIHEALEVFSLLIGARDVFLLDGANRNPQDQMRIKKSLERFLPEPRYFGYPYYSKHRLYVLYTTQQIPPEIVKTFDSDQDAIAPYMDYPCWGDLGGRIALEIYVIWDGKPVQVWASLCATLTDERQAAFLHTYVRFEQSFQVHELKTEMKISTQLREKDVGGLIMAALYLGNWDALQTNMPELGSSFFDSYPYEQLWGTLDTTNASTLKRSMTRYKALWYAIALDFYHNVMPAIPWSEEEYKEFETDVHERIEKYIKRVDLFAK